MVGTGGMVDVEIAACSKVKGDFGLMVRHLILAEDENTIWITAFATLFFVQVDEPFTSNEFDIECAFTRHRVCVFFLDLYEGQMRI